MSMTDEKNPPKLLQSPIQIPNSVNKIKKPNPYTHIKRNVYLVKKRKRSTENLDNGMQCSCKICDKDCLCAMLNSICSSTCRCAKSCSNKPLHQRLVKRLRLSQTEKCGWGVKAGEDIKAGEFVIEYVGEVIDHKICRERVMKLEENGETNFYLCEIGGGLVVDATFKGNKSRFINHSCNPNCVLQKWEDDGETTTGLFAKSDIRKGEFITYDYQFIQFGMDQPCYCGATDCRGFLGAKPKPNSHARSQKIDGIVPKCIGLRVRVWWPLDQEFYSGTIVGYDTDSDKHRIVYDDGDSESLVMLNETWEFDRKEMATSLVSDNLHCEENPED
ncbi:histone-lysine N-methyltransferase ASHH3 [Cryptomeria japonica]|uniref:histone-lysine N-methyltransferase ASHH3 n=1 Tax=Cryptomeria japonica TaxID=3369 RepID=UPI0027DA869F|nr:histone-lysine N-methyltransferase ASHH3 [Cryptomeria japonica]